MAGAFTTGTKSRAHHFGMVAGQGLIIFGLEPYVLQGPHSFSTFVIYQLTVRNAFVKDEQPRFSRVVFFLRHDKQHVCHVWDTQLPFIRSYFCFSSHCQSISPSCAAIAAFGERLFPSTCWLLFMGFLAIGAKRQTSAHMR